MCTKPRIVAPGVFYKISSKGVHNLNLFLNDELKSFFLDQLSITLKKYSFTCFAFSITKNQYNLVLQSDQQSISNAMQYFNSILARKANKILGRDGTVFATRFRSLIIEKEQVKNLIRAVHLEPVKLGECSFQKLDTYNWCSHRHFLSNSKLSCLNSDALKMFYDGSKEVYRTHMKCTYDNSIFNSILKNAECGKQGFSKPEMWIVGKPEFVKQVIELDRIRRLRIARHISENITIDKIHEDIAKLLALNSNDLYQAGQLNVRSNARELLAYISKQRYDFTGTQVAQHLKVTDSAVTKMIKRFNNVENGTFLIKSIVKEMN